MNKSEIKKNKIWIDMDNSPHVPFFRPIINELERRGNEVVITARDCFETIKLLKLYNMRYKKIGKHYGQNKIKKIYGLLFRSIQLCLFAKNKRIDLAVSHGSRALVLCGTILDIPLVSLYDYEHTIGFPSFIGVKVRKYIVPESIEDVRLFNTKKANFQVYRFPGIKEDVYLSQFEPNPKSLSSILLDESRIIVILRPPASQAHYHNPRADKIFISILKKLSKEKNAQIVLLPRIDEQKMIALAIFKNSEGHLILPDRVIDGLNFLWKSDLVISGGGTMVREAAGLGIPTYSFFCGKVGGVDRYLESQSRLTFIREEKDVKNIKLIKRDNSLSNIRRNNIVPQITDEILNALE